MKPVYRRASASLFVVSLALVGGGWLLQRSEPASGSFYAQSRLFDDVRRLVASEFVDSVGEAKLYADAANGLVRSLGDPHTALFTPKRRSEFEVEVNGQYGGVGLRVGQIHDLLTVTSVIANTPAERAGLLAGDRILEITDTSTTGWSVDRAASRLRGRMGTPVTITVARPGHEGALEFTLVREAVRLSAVTSSYLLENGVGYVGVGAISDGSAEEVERALRDLRNRGMRSVILDLRGNGGGYLGEAVGISQLFLDAGKVVVETRGRKSDDNQKYPTRDSRPPFRDIPVAVLVDPNTASAAEIIAGALQDYDRAMLIGQRTYGKGVAQLMFPLPGGYSLKMTVERWYTPSGRSIQKMPVAAGATDTLTAGDSIFHSLGGRRLVGGGGIVPDVTMNARDTITTAERNLQQALADAARGNFSETLFDFAVAYRLAHPQLQPDFTVSDKDLADFRSALAAAGMPVERSVFEAAAPLLRRRLEVQISWARFGEAEARRRANEGDHQIDLAADLLSRSQNAQQLLSLARTVPQG